MSDTYTPLQEWCDKNAHRSYPVKEENTCSDITGNFELPSSFIVDAHFYIPVELSQTGFYIKNLYVFSDYAVADIGYTQDGYDVIVGSFTNIDLNGERNQVYYLEPATQDNSDNKLFETCKGALVIGSGEDLKKYPGQWEFVLDGTGILETVISTGLAALSSLTVHDTVLRGNVVLQEGAGVRIRPVYDDETGVTTIIISADPFDTSDSSLIINSDEDILNSIINKYGRPITKINGEQPDPNGNFTLIGRDCSEITELPSNHALVFENPCSSPCCDKSELERIYGSVSELNLKGSRFEQFFNNLAQRLNEMQARMVALEIG